MNFAEQSRLFLTILPFFLDFCSLPDFDTASSSQRRGGRSQIIHTWNYSFIHSGWGSNFMFMCLGCKKKRSHTHPLFDSEPHLQDPHGQLLNHQMYQVALPVASTVTTRIYVLVVAGSRLHSGHYLMSSSLGLVGEKTKGKKRLNIQFDFSFLFFFAFSIFYIFIAGPFIGPFP